MLSKTKLAAAVAAAVAWSCLSPAPACADQLTYYAYPSPIRINWSTPQDLAWTTVLSNLVVDMRFLNLHAIGHVNFDLRCDPSPSAPGGIRIMTGQTNSDDSQMTTLLFKEGYGLGVLLADYLGRWETPAEIEADLPERFKTGRIAFIQFEISPSTCARVAEYLGEYQSRGYDKIYGGLEDRPRLGQGAGCAAFGESILEIGGLLAPEWAEDWQQSLNVPLDLIGGPLTGNQVGALELLFGYQAREWNRSPAGSYPLDFWNPQRMVDWIRKAWKTPMPLTGQFAGTTYHPMRLGRARGIVIDASNVPTPTDALFSR